MSDSAIKYFTDRQMLYFLSSLPEVGNKTIFKIYENIKPLENLLFLSGENIKGLSRISDKAVYIIKQNSAKAEEVIKGLEALEKRDIGFCCFFEEEYPHKLQEIEDKPASLYFVGDLSNEALKRPSVAIVGSRANSNYGKEMARFISGELTKRGVDIVSGMAYGVDAYAHRTALKNGGRTYAVLGCGINICYPRENIDIFEQIRESRAGAVLSEFPLQTPPLAANFPGRNRIISALSDIVIVVEARVKSGSLITASCALEQGKEVYAVPGRLCDTLSQGCNRLIADGAGILTSIDDIIESLGLLRDKKIPLSEKNHNTLANNEKMVYSCLDLTPKYLEDIIQETELDYAQVIGILLDLELRGFVKQVSGNYYVKSCD